MKWFAKVFLLLLFSMLCESSIHAYICTSYSINAGIKPKEVEVVHKSGELNQNGKSRYSLPGLIKKEYWKLRGTYEENDDNEYVSSVKKTKVAKVILLKADKNKFVLSLSLKRTGLLCSYQQPFQYCPNSSSYLNNKALYSLFQVFLI